MFQPAASAGNVYEPLTCLAAILPVLSGLCHFAFRFHSTNVANTSCCSAVNSIAISFCCLMYHNLKFSGTLAHHSTQSQRRTTMFCLSRTTPDEYKILTAKRDKNSAEQADEYQTLTAKRKIRQDRQNAATFSPTRPSKNMYMSLLYRKGNSRLCSACSPARPDAAEVTTPLFYNLTQRDIGLEALHCQDFDAASTYFLKCILIVFLSPECGNPLLKTLHLPLRV